MFIHTNFPCSTAGRDERRRKPHPPAGDVRVPGAGTAGLRGTHTMGHWAHAPPGTREWHPGVPYAGGQVSMK